MFCFRTQGQYVFIHDVILHKLQSLGYGVTPSDADSFDENAEEDIYASKCEDW